MTDKNTGETEEVPAGLAVWCSASSSTRCAKIMDTLPEVPVEQALARDRQEPARESPTAPSSPWATAPPSSARGRWRRR